MLRRPVEIAALSGHCIIGLARISGLVADIAFLGQDQMQPDGIVTLDSPSTSKKRIAVC